MKEKNDKFTVDSRVSPAALLLGLDGYGPRDSPTGIYNNDGSMMTYIEIGSESEVLASRRLTTGVRDNDLQHEGVTSDGRIGVVSHLIKAALKRINSAKGFCKLFLERLKGRCGHGSNVVSGEMKEPNEKHSNSHPDKTL